MKYRKKKKVNSEKIGLVVFSILLIITTLLLVQKFYKKESAIQEDLIKKLNITEESLKEVLNVSNFEKVENISMEDQIDSVKVTLRTKCYELIGYIDNVQANSIRIARGEIKRERPTTHDLMKDIFDSFNLEVLLMKITEIRGSNYIGLLVVKGGNKIVSFDVRPSDGIAIALRTNSSIYISQDLLKSRGNYIC